MHCLARLLREPIHNRLGFPDQQPVTVVPLPDLPRMQTEGKSSGERMLFEPARSDKSLYEAVAAGSRQLKALENLREGHGAVFRDEIDDLEGALC